MAIQFKLNTSVYPKEAILNACYVFMDRAYFLLDAPANGQYIKVSLKCKRKASKRQIKILKDEFLNELLHCVLRSVVSKNNKKIREYIIGRAIYSSLPINAMLSAGSKDFDYRRDPLGIAVPWEEKYKKSNAKVKV